METLFVPKTIFSNGKTARLCTARRTYGCDLPGCTGVILPGQEYYLISCPQTDAASYRPPERVHVTDIEQYLKRDGSRKRNMKSGAI
jgi:hypothetical protein